MISFTKQGSLLQFYDFYGLDVLEVVVVLKLRRVDDREMVSGMIVLDLELDPDEPANGNQFKRASNLLHKQ